MCFDLSSNKFFMFDNDTYEIVIFCLSSEEPICRIKTAFQRKDVSLYFHVRASTLMIIGGYCQEGATKDCVKGSNHIELFGMKSRAFETEPKILDIGMGRLRPIIFEMKIKN